MRSKHLLLVSVRCQQCQDNGATQRNKFAFGITIFETVARLHSFKGETPMSLFKTAGLLIAAFTSISSALASDIVVGQVAPLSGLLAPTGNHVRAGAQIYFDAVNASGGINGQKIRLVSKDDGYKVPETIKQTKALIEEVQPVALFGYVGTGNVEAVLKEKILDENGIPLVMVRTGASSLAKSGNPWMFITRAGYAGEINKIFQLYSATGYKNYAVFYQNDPFGLDGLASAEALSEKYGSKIVAKGSYEKNTTEVANAVKTITAAAPHAVIMVSNTAASAAFIKQARDGGLRTQFIAISTTDATQLVDLIGAPTAAGVAITQVVPHPENRTVPLSKEFQDNFAKFKPQGVLFNHALLEGYVGAKVLVEGLRRAGPGATRRKLRDALEQIKNFDTGDLLISYSPSNRAGTTFADINIISNSGKLLK